MKLLIVNNEGEVVHAIEDIETYDLSKALARVELCNEIQEHVTPAWKRGA